MYVAIYISSGHLMFNLLLESSSCSDDSSISSDGISSHPSVFGCLYPSRPHHRRHRQMTTRNHFHQRVSAYDIGSRLFLEIWKISLSVIGLTFG